MNHLISFLISVFLAGTASAQISVSTLTDEFNGSGGVKIGPDGMVYIADFGAALGNADGTQVWRYDPIEDTLTVFATGLSGASGNDFDSQGNLFQSNIAIGSIRKISPQGTVSPFTSMGIFAPVGIVIDADDNLFVCNCGNSTIQKITPSGVSTLFSSNPAYACPNGITMDHQGNLYMSNFNDGSVFLINEKGNGTLFATIPGSNNGHITFSEADSMLYLASHGSSSIYRITLDGTVSLLAGSGIRGNQDGPDSTASFSRPNGIAASVTGDTLYVNSSVPVSNVGLPLNPSLLRMITGLHPAQTTAIESPTLYFEQVDLFPNPVSDCIQLIIDVSRPSLISYTLNALDGRLVLNAESNLLAGSNRLEISLASSISDGMYMLTIDHPEQSISRMVQIRRE